MTNPKSAGQVVGWRLFLAHRVAGADEPKICRSGGRLRLLLAHRMAGADEPKICRSGGRLEASAGSQGGGGWKIQNLQVRWQVGGVCWLTGWWGLESPNSAGQVAGWRRLLAHRVVGAGESKFCRSGSRLEASAGSQGGGGWRVQILQVRRQVGGVCWLTGWWGLESPKSAGQAAGWRRLLAHRVVGAGESKFCRSGGRLEASAGSQGGGGWRVQILQVRRQIGGVCWLTGWWGLESPKSAGQAAGWRRLLAHRVVGAGESKICRSGGRLEASAGSQGGGGWRIQNLQVRQQVGGVCWLTGWWGLESPNSAGQAAGWRRLLAHRVVGAGESKFCRSGSRLEASAGS
ncbi:P2Y purinoceptor 1 isoform X2 [Loxodonta africana]|uniref:P2Y purinoceptor 1 isoform X2 n=1 Tax=Loxodonta africana TaxID=9785 RepID=UPI0030CB554C